MTTDTNDKHGLRKTLDLLYHGRSQRTMRFRIGLLAFDCLTVTFFIVSSMVELNWWVIAVDMMIAAVLSVELIIRFWIAKKPVRFLFEPMSLADIVVIVTLLAPAFLENFAFLRAIRVLRLLRSYHILSQLREASKFFKRNEEILHSILNLTVFIFFVTALVYVMQVRINPLISNYIDALYFTVTTLTTTGFGDVTLEGSTGRLLAVGIMVFGVGLFLRLVQTIFRPYRVHHECPTCSLRRHDSDAIHCKHCGETLNIESDGEWV
jgi:voltage-gated potassium channel